MVTTSDPEIAKRCRLLRDHGQDPKYYHSMFAVNDRLDEIQAAILRVKLPHLDEWTANRRNSAKAFNDGLPDTVVKPVEMPWGKHVYHLYVIRTPHREELRTWLDNKGISSGMHYPVPIHQQEVWNNYTGNSISLPVTEKVVGEILSLPMYPELSNEEVNYICESVREFTDSQTKAVVSD